MAGNGGQKHLNSEVGMRKSEKREVGKVRRWEGGKVRRWEVERIGHGAQRMAQGVEGKAWCADGIKRRKK